MHYIKLDTISLKAHPEMNEQWLQERIAEDPAILGLGDLVLKDRERPQPKAGRLDILLQDPDTARRYEVEIQLGRSDESHIIRTIEYWDIERKRYPQYDHCAVIVAEDITSRFLNVIGLFNGVIPIIAIQMTAVKVDNSIGLLFTTILDETRLGLVDDDEEIREVTDRAYWEARGTPETVKWADRLLELVQERDAGFELKYNKFYIGLAEDNRPNNFILFQPKKKTLNLQIRLPRSDELDSIIDSADLDIFDYDAKWGRYRLRLKKHDIDKKHETIAELIRLAYENWAD